MKTRLTGEEVKLIRALRNAKVSDVATIINRYPSAITYVETGQRASFDEIQSDLILKAFGIDEDLLQMIRRTIRLSKI